MASVVSLWIGLAVLAGGLVLAAVDLLLALGGAAVQWAEEWREILAGEG